MPAKATAAALPPGGLRRLAVKTNPREGTMRATTGQTTAPALRALLTDGTLAGEWVLDSHKSSVLLKSRNLWGLIAVNGDFREVSGYGTVSADGQVGGTLVVAAESIGTGNARRDRHLRSADFFNADHHPDIIFTADGIRPSGHGVAVTGALTVRGRTRAMSFDAAAAVRGDGEICLGAEVRVNRADFGLTWNLMGMAAMGNTVIIRAVFTRP
jgi:polyisoprenoid-binding protein YceI